MDKKTLILTHAVALFAEKGYHLTTIQDIADAAGIAKGGIYFYFKSKEELLLSVVTEYFDRLFNDTVEAGERYPQAPKEGLVQQILCQFHDVASKTSLFSLFSRGQIEVNAEIKAVLIGARGKFLVLFRDRMIDVYGQRVEPYAFDLAVLLTALVREYTGFITMNGAALPIRRLAETIVARIDDAAAGVLRSHEPPMLTTAFMKYALPDIDIREGSDVSRRLGRALDALLQRVGEAADLMKEEAAKPKPRRIVLEGMAALLDRTFGEAAAEELAEVRRAVEAFA